MSTNPVTTDQEQFLEAMKDFQQRIDGTFGVMVRDLDSGLELAWNEDDIYPTASTLKIPLLYELYRQAEAGDIDLTARVTLRKDERVPGSGVLQYLDEGLQPTVRDLAELMIIVSDNWATDLLFHMVGPERLATTMDDLGLHHTRIPYSTWQILSQMGGVDPHDPEMSYDALLGHLKDSARDSATDERAAVEATDYSSPADMVRLLELIEQGHGLSAESRQAIIDILKHQNFKAVIPGRLPDGEGIETAHKTGSVRGVRNDAGIVYAPGMRYAIAIMSKDLEDTVEAVAQFAYISRWVWDHMKARQAAS